MRDKITSMGMLLTAAILWGSSFTARKMGLADIGPLMQNTARFFVAAVFMIVVILLTTIIKKEKIKNALISLKDQIRYGLIIGLAFGIGNIFQQIGLTYVDSGQVGFLTSMYTILVPILSFIFFKEHIRKQVWYGVILAMVGLMLVTKGSLGFSIGYVILILGSMMFALQIIFIGRFVNKSNPLILVTIQLIIGTIVNLIMALVTREPFEFDMLQDAFGIIIYTGIFSLGIANMCHFIGQKKSSPSVAAIICSFESVFALIFGTIILHEKLGTLQAIGCMLMFAAVIVAQWERRNVLY